MRDWWNENWTKVVIPGAIVLVIVLVTLPVWSSWGKPLDRTMHRSVKLELDELDRLSGHNLDRLDVNASDISDLIATAISDPEFIIVSNVLPESPSRKRWDQLVSYQAERIAQSGILPPNASIDISSHVWRVALVLTIKDPSDGNRPWVIPLKEVEYTI